VVQTVGTADQAQRAVADGADGLIVQGIEAGGHLFGVERAADALPRVLACAGDAPVLLAGGIADGADARRALDGGAVAVVAGTRFLLTHECPAHPEYKRRVLEADRTFETRLFGLGWPMRHRVVPNAATDRWCRGGSLGPWPILALQALSQPLARLPLKLVAGTVRTQRPSVPLFGPASALRGMPDRLVDATGLYAGETALRIDSLVTAAEAVEILAGKAAGPSTQSPTISRS
jgi:NAD(P)H-dependent flavin oxidoreductase YrpB (nitropropane dioxygenase family)